MSISCSKEYTLTIASGTSLPVPFAYFKCDEPDGTNVLYDTIGGSDLISAVPTVSKRYPGKISNCVAGGNGFSSYQSAFNEHYCLGGDWTIRLWLYFPTPYPTTGYILGAEGASTEWYLRSLFGGTTLRFYANAPTAKFHDIACPSADTWHRIVFWMEAGVRMGIVVDNGAPAYLAITGSIACPQSTTLGAAGFGENPFYVDEIAIWSGLLDSTQLDEDWNGGAGKTYPF